MGGCACVCARVCAQECSPRRRTGDGIRGLVPVLDASTSERREPPSGPPDTGNRPQVFPCESKHLNQHLAALLCAWTLEPAVIRLTWTIRYHWLVIRNFVLCSICDRLSRVGHTCQCCLGCDAGIVKVYWWRQRCIRCSACAEFCTCVRGAHTCWRHAVLTSTGLFKKM